MKEHGSKNNIYTEKAFFEIFDINLTSTGKNISLFGTKLYLNIISEDLEKESIYNIPAFNCIHILFKTLDDIISNNPTEKKEEIEKDINLLKVLFIIKFIIFINNQGSKIVSSLDHLLFEFLTFRPRGIKEYNNLKKQNNLEQLMFKIDNTELIDKDELKSSKDQNSELKLKKYYEYASKYTSEFKILSAHSNMIELVQRKFSYGLNNILELINDDIYLINSINILRPQKIKDGNNVDDYVKRCTGASESLIFGDAILNNTTDLNSNVEILSLINNNNNFKQFIIDYFNNISNSKNKTITSTISSEIKYQLSTIIKAFAKIEKIEIKQLIKIISVIESKQILINENINDTDYLNKFIEVLINNNFEIKDEAETSEEAAGWWTGLIASLKSKIGRGGAVVRMEDIKFNTSGDKKKKRQKTIKKNKYFKNKTGKKRNKKSDKIKEIKKSKNKLKITKAIVKHL